MNWSKTLAKIGWFLVFVIFGALGDAAFKPELSKLVGDNSLAHASLPLLGALALSLKDWWRHRKPDDGDI